MKRVYHRYEDWEEYHAGMWRIIRGEERKPLKDAAADHMKNTTDFEESMTWAVTHWPNSCEHWLTCSSVNHRAWLGHAGCCVSTTAPEDITREAWHTLTQEQQDEANAAADRALEKWRTAYAETRTR